MKNIIGKGISGRKYFYFGWSYLYFSFGYFFCRKIYSPLFDEYNIFKFTADGNILLA